MSKKILLCLLIILSFSFCNYCFAHSSTKPVRMAYLQNDIHHLAFWVALEKGYFDQQNVQVEVSGIFKAGPEIMSAFAARGLDMAYVGEAPFTTAVANKAANVQVVAQVNTEGSALVVRKDSPIDSITDLAGKTVAVPGHSTVQDFLLRKALSQNGLERGEVNVIVLKPPEMISALRTNQIDAFIAWEPYPSKASSMEIGHNLATSHAIWPDHPCCVLVTANQFLQENKEKVRKIIKAHIKATQFIHAHPEKAVAIGEKYTGMDRQTVQKAMQTVNYTPKLSIEGEKRYVQFLNELKYIRVADPDEFIEKYINQDLLQEIQAK
jgi:NitT/TauT family transport system substrate-binding protein